LAGLLTAVAFVPEASAIPAFARQTGLACKACHFQHFPLLNSFGRAFKSSGFTMMGAQAKVEDEHLSIPATLNMSGLTTIGYQKQSNNVAASNQYLLPVSGGELSLFFGGHISDFAGFLTEVGMTGGGGAASAGAAKLPLLWDVGNNTRVGLVAASGGPGPAYSFELLNTGAVDTHRLMSSRGANEEHFAASSAFGYLRTNKVTSMGASLVASGDMGFVNIGKYAVNGPTISTAPNSNTLNTTYARGVYMFNAGGWDSAVGIQNFSGRDGTAAIGLDTKATFIDGQMQGEAGGMPLGIYASYGRAPGSVHGNVFNGAAGVNNTNRKSFNIAAELGVIPHKATLQLALRSGNTGTLAATPVADKDSAIMIGGTYELAQNVELLLHHTSQSGSSWNTGGTNNPAGTAVAGKTMTSLILEALF